MVDLHLLLCIQTPKSNSPQSHKQPSTSNTDWFSSKILLSFSYWLQGLGITGRSWQWELTNKPLQSLLKKAKILFLARLVFRINTLRFSGLLDLSESISIVKSWSKVGVQTLNRPGCDFTGMGWSNIGTAKCSLASNSLRMQWQWLGRNMDLELIWRKLAFSVWKRKDDGWNEGIKTDHLHWYAVMAFPYFGHLAGSCGGMWEKLFHSF